MVRPPCMRAELYQLGVRLLSLAKSEDASSEKVRAPLLPPDILLQRAVEQVSLRAMRNEFFSDLFREPAWDILLDILIQDLRERPVSVSDACIASRVPQATALRYIAVLEQQGLIKRRADKRDKRRFYLSLTQSGFKKLHLFFSRAEMQVHGTMMSRLENHVLADDDRDLADKSHAS